MIDKKKGEFVPPEIPLDRDRFMLRLMGDLVFALEELVGREESENFISAAGIMMGGHIDQLYLEAIKHRTHDPAELGSLLVDLKRRIDGDFRVVSASEEKIVLRNTRCPFGDFVKGQNSLCMMTSSVFGKLASENTGYAKVDIKEAIAMGHKGCLVEVWLKENAASRKAAGREFRKTRADDQAPGSGPES